MVLIEVPLSSLRGPFSQSRKPYGHVLKASLSIIPTRHLDERAQDLLDDPLSLMVVSCKDLCPHLDAALTEDYRHLPLASTPAPPSSSSSRQKAPHDDRLHCPLCLYPFLSTAR